MLHDGYDLRNAWPLVMLSSVEKQDNSMKGETVTPGAGIDLEFETDGAWWSFETWLGSYWYFYIRDRIHEINRGLKIFWSKSNLHLDRFTHNYLQQMVGVEYSQIFHSKCVVVMLVCVLYQIEAVGCENRPSCLFFDLLIVYFLTF